MQYYYFLDPGQTPRYFRNSRANEKTIKLTWLVYEQNVAQENCIKSLNAN